MRHIFFFSSRRRHTRLQGDWSSDVCSSDLHLAGKAGGTRQLCDHTPAPALKTGHPRNDNCSCSGNKKGHPMGGLFAGIKKLRSIPKRIKRGREEKRFGRRSEERRVGKECRSRWSP